MNQLFQRKPIAELVAESESPHGLKRALGPGDLIMLSIGAVIGAGIFSSIGTAAAGEVLPSGEVVAPPVPLKSRPQPAWREMRGARGF